MVWEVKQWLSCMQKVYFRLANIAQKRRSMHLLKQIECTVFRKFKYIERRFWAMLANRKSTFCNSWAGTLTEASVKIVSMRVKTLTNKSLEASRSIKESPLVDVRASLKDVFAWAHFLLRIEFIGMGHQKQQISVKITPPKNSTWEHVKNQ